MTVKSDPELLEPQTITAEPLKFALFIRFPLNYMQYQLFE
jgi:hypothetical protein